MAIVEFIHAERHFDLRIGYRKLWLLYLQDCEPISRSVFLAVMSRHGLLLRRLRRSTRTTFSLHGQPTYPNLVYSTIPQRPCQIWVADITYLRIRNPDNSRRFCYLNIVMDAYSRYIMGYYIGLTLETVYTTIALAMAIETANQKELDITGLIHHSDRGCQYASADYVAILKSNNIKISMTQTGNPKDNPQAERINNTVKVELFDEMEFSSIEEARALLPAKIDYYNNRRPHMSIDNMTPAQALNHNGTIRKHWKSYRDLAIEKEKKRQR